VIYDTMVLPRNKKERAKVLQNLYDSGYQAGYNAGSEERRSPAPTLRNQMLDQAKELMQEASKMMSRVGYLVDKVNNVRS